MLLKQKWQEGLIDICRLHGVQPGSTVASLREDYLNQVQRDFLSRRRITATPLADAFLL